jgi:hypothetical protein
VPEAGLAREGAQRISPNAWALFLAGFFAVASCAKTPPSAGESSRVTAAGSPAKQSAATQPAAVTPSGVTPTSASSALAGSTTASHPAVGQTDFVAYWHELRRALSSANSEAVAQLAEFPFTVRGEMDSDPVQRIERGAFPDVLRRLLAQDVGLSPKPESLSQYLARTPDPPANALQGRTARVATMEFELLPGGWRFVGAYLGDSE